LAHYVSPSPLLLVDPRHGPLGLRPLNIKVIQWNILWDMLVGDFWKH
jgi:hypothetical protein